ncbi:aldose epimerase family protein [Planococcus halotolerans]|uniref:Aldose 1-epimerase n=1 Tax=Planococcus halotolerans TaxID=2233542 RepID=A0A365KXS5_9BACL|nr:aldose epimerase family protein [Planococcus halotolerans]QHJ69170.1 galactose-1-epimerase [Planococcus halotolerans]RAZ77627.1 galactose-1-epimerase [Planococcus halotolerans]
MTAEQQAFGKSDGQPVTLYTIKNEQGFQVSCINYGCIITEILAPDQSGKMENVVLGFDSLEEYERDVHYLGAVAGRFAGRIKDGAAELAGTSYRLGRNANGHHLHGGAGGFHSVVWNAAPFEETDGAGVDFTYKSPDGEEGYPGNLEMTVRYFVKHDRNELIISYNGTSDQPTLLNPTNHAYFNLSGDLKRDVLDHHLQLPGEAYLELDDELLPTGRILPVVGTVFDLRDGNKIRRAAESEDPQTRLAGHGYDHPFVLEQAEGSAILLTDEESGRTLSVATTEPAVVLYTGNGLGGPYSLRGTPARNHLGLCLETQKLPDSLRHQNFSSSVLQAGQRYHSETSFSFGVLDKE